MENELYSNCTLSFEGETTTYGSVTSKNATTHSYTIQLMISLDGRLVESMYLCLQETKGRLGDTVQRNLFQPKNVVITCSTSGKLTSSLVKYWKDRVLSKSIGKKALILSDSWTSIMMSLYIKISSQSAKRLNDCKYHPKQHHIFNHLTSILTGK